MNYTQIQPKDGERVLLCAHAAESDHGQHFFKTSCVRFMRPDGSLAEASWVILCESCFLLHAADPFCVVCADALWEGNEPIIQEDES